MAKRTAIIDIGSNSARLVIFERTSRFGFHLICEQKSKVRIGEGAYAKGGHLQSIGIERAYLALQSFIQTTKKYQVNKILCVATSALRDAPNGQNFISWIKSNLKLSIKIIDGDEEAKLGAIAANNLLPIGDAITIDIGGGSSDIALIRKGEVVDTYSLNIGTVRIKELFFDRQASREEALAYIRDEIKRLPDAFHHHIAVGIGGTARALSKGIMKKSNYPFDKLHAFSYRVEDQIDYLTGITLSTMDELDIFYLKRGRYDTIREGTMILLEILKQIGTKEVITSGVGVRDGLFLKDMLRQSDLQFPKGLNPSIRSILDRFDNLTAKNSSASHRIEIASELYRVCHDRFDLPKKYKFELYNALRLSNIGKTLTIYKSSQHAFYIATQELNYGFTHAQMLLISLLLRTSGGRLSKRSLLQTYRELLPKKRYIRCLSFIYNLTILLHENANDADILFHYSDQTLTIKADQSLYHAKEAIALLDKPHDFSIVIDDISRVPRYEF
ncbi:MAG: Ppx/GppA phosphatase family protein [Campylobacterota bacterium]|nr:Ppx/GppA phosphatase family protein [Campylobacterota bacterium]